MVQLVRSLPSHTDKVWSLSIHNTLPYLASVSTDRTCVIHDLTNGELITTLDDTHKRSIRSVAWKPTGVEPSLACGSFDSTISIWSQDDTEWSLLAVIEGHENEVKGVSWSHNGYYLASCSRDKSIWIWECDDDNEEFECISVLQEHSQDVKHVVWHPEHEILASSSYDDTIKIWREDDDDWVCLTTLTGHNGTVWCSDFQKSEESIRLVSGSDDSSVKIWKQVDEENWELEATLPAVHTRAVYSVSWSSSGKIASTGSDGQLVVYDEKPEGWTVVDIKKLAHGVQEVNTVQWCKSYGQGEEWLITGGDDGDVNIWRI